MKDRELWNVMRGIDPSYIIDAAPRETETVNRGGLLWRRWVTVAACLVILLCAIPISRQVMNGFTPVGPGDETTDGYVNPDFVIEDGVLLLYTGDNPHVIIPDEVREISRDAFAEKGDVIETIYIGKNVEAVDSLFLSEVKHLAGIEVAEENERFEIYEGVFVDKNNLVFIQTSDNRQLDLERFIHVVEQINDEKLYLGETCEIAFGKATIVLTLKRGTLHSTGEKYTKAYYSQITFQGITLKLNDLVQYNAEFELYQNDDMLFFSHFERYLLTKDKVYDLNREYDYLKDLEEPVYRYSQDEGGVIHYEMRPLKYPFNAQGYEDLLFGLYNTMGLDDFFEEEGYLTVEDGELTYVPTATYTMETGGELERYEYAFRWFQSGTDGIQPFEPLFTEFDSIEELFAYNKQQKEKS